MIFKRIRNFFSLNTLRGRIALGYLLLFVVVLLNGGYLFYYLNAEVFSPINGAMNTLLPVRQHAAQLRGAVGQSHLTLSDYLATSALHYREKREQLWATELQPLLDSLAQHADALPPEATSMVYDVRIKANKLREVQEKIESEHYTRVLSDDFRAARIAQLSDLELIADDLLFSLEALQERLARELRIRQAHSEAKYSLLRRILLPVLGLDIFLLLLIFIYLSHRGIVTRMSPLEAHLNQLAQGNIPAPLKSQANETVPLTESVNGVRKEFLAIQEFAKRIGEGQLQDEEIELSGEIGAAIKEMQASLRKVSVREEKSKWSISGIAHFADLMRKYEDDLEELCVQFTAQIVGYLGGVQAGLYLQENGQNDPSAPLVLKAWYAGEQRRFRNATFEPGEGLVGEVFREKATRILERIPEGYAYVESGLGATEVKYMLLVPVVVNEQALGVLEIAALKPLAQHEIEFAENVAEDLAGEVLSILVNQQTRRLLQEAQMREEAMRAQEEEMRQNMEELQATQEEMQRKEAEIRRMLEEANTRELELKESLDKIEDVKEDLERKNTEVERMKEEEKRRSEMQIQAQKELIEKLNRKNEEAMEQAVLLRKKEEQLSQKMEEMEEVQLKVQKQNERLVANESVLKKAFEKAKTKDKELREAVRLAEEQRRTAEENAKLLEKQKERLVANENVLKKAFAKSREKDKALQQALKAAEVRERKLQHIIDAWPHLLVILNGDLQIEFFNKAFATLYHSRGMELEVGTPILFQLPENQRDNYSQYFLRVLEDGEDVQVQETYEDTDGKIHHFYTELHPLLNPKGEVEGLFITSQEKKRA